MPHRVVDARTPARRAAVLVVLAAALWWHAWMPALIVVAFVAWALLHSRYQGVRREAFLRLRGRVWPPPPVVVLALVVAGTALYATSRGMPEAKAMPIALNVLAAGTLVAGAWRARVGAAPEARDVAARA